MLGVAEIALFYRVLGSFDYVTRLGFVLVKTECAVDMQARSLPASHNFFGSSAVAEGGERLAVLACPQC
jgi:hypothetical protein